MILKLSIIYCDYLLFVNILEKYLGHLPSLKSAVVYCWWVMRVHDIFWIINLYQIYDLEFLSFCVCVCVHVFQFAHSMFWSKNSFILMKYNLSIFVDLYVPVLH